MIQFIKHTVIYLAAAWTVGILFLIASALQKRLLALILLALLLLAAIGFPIALIVFGIKFL